MYMYHQSSPMDKTNSFTLIFDFIVLKENIYILI